jgi:hypothetical protein
MTNDFGSPDPGLGQTQKCGRFKPVNGTPTLPCGGFKPIIGTQPFPLDNWISNGNTYFNK